MDSIITFFNEIHFVLTVGLPDFINEGFIWIAKNMVYVGLSLKYTFLTFSVDVATAIMEDLNISDTIETSFNSLDSQTLSIATFFKIPVLIQNVVTAYTTRFVMGMLS